VFGKKKYIIGGALVIGAFVFLLYMMDAFGTPTVYVDEALAREGTAAERLRVEGELVAGSVVRAGDLKLEFVMAWEGMSLPVVYSGAIPDTFQEDAEMIVVEGSLDDAGVFQSDLIMTKCPSKYDPEEE
jgi:cytochrome c-type biogenesis protein CcmE